MNGIAFIIGMIVLGASIISAGKLMKEAFK